jgi:hypothetical protein
MIQPFVNHFMASKDDVIASLKEHAPTDYEDLVKRLVVLLAETPGDGDAPDLTRIVKIDHGEYQGTLLFIIGASGYQPSVYWYIFVGYGSCSDCDTFEAIGLPWNGEPASEEQVNELWTLMLHMVQKMKRIGGYEEAV